MISVQNHRPPLNGNSQVSVMGREGSTTFPVVATRFQSKIMMVKVVLSFSFAFFLQGSLFAQVDFTKQYFNAKTLFREGKYNLAMESFKPLIPYDRSNPFAEYASFYYALSAYNLGYKALSKSTLTQTETMYPTWDKADEVKLWIGKINLEDKDYFQGLKVLSAIRDKKFAEVVESIKKKSISEITDVETLNMMREEYPTDRIVAEALATHLSQTLTNAEDKKALEALIQEFNFNRADFIPEAPKTFFKDAYSLSVLLPFMVNTLDPSPTLKRNQSVLDLYEGMKLAVDTLSKKGIKVGLRAYDTERSVEKIKKVLATDELKNTDLIVGPFFQEESKSIAEFSLEHKINTINPVHNNNELIGINPYAFLFQPTLETLGRKSGEFLARYATRKSCLVIYGTSSRDSVLAANFIQAAKEKGLRIVGSRKLSREASPSVLSMLAKPTEFDDYHNPKEFTLKKDSIGSIFVASDEALIYAKVISSIETRGDQIIVMGSKTWLDQNAVPLEKFQNLPVVFFAPNFAEGQKPAMKAFKRKYLKTHGRAPSDYAEIGYELMLFLGYQLKQHGVYFQEGMSKSGVIPGYISEGFDYQFGRTNERVTFIRFDQGVLTVVENK